MKQALFLVLSVISLCCRAEVICGDTVTADSKYNMHWEYDNITSSLTISGNAVLDYYEYETDYTIPDGNIRDNLRQLPPWYYFKDQVRTIFLVDGITYIGCHAFQNMSQLESVTIPSSLTVISPMSFMNCTQLHNIVLPEKLTEIGKNAFSGCSSLEQIDLPKGVISINDKVFLNCVNLKRITISEATKQIKTGAFEGCVNLKSLSMDNMVQSFAVDALSGSGITELKVKWLNPMSISRNNNGDGIGNSRTQVNVVNTLDANALSKITLVVPKGTLNNYASSLFWSQFGIIKENDVPPMDDMKYMMKYYAGFDYISDANISFYNITKSVFLPECQLMKALCEEHNIDTSSRAQYSSIGLNWLEYITKNNIVDLVTECDTLKCNDGDIYVIKRVPEDFWNMLSDTYNINLDRCVNEKTYGRVDDYYCNVDSVVRVSIDENSVNPYGGYYKVKRASTSANPKIGFDIICPMMPTNQYKIEVVMAPNGELSEISLPNRFRVTWYDSYYDGSDDVSELQKGLLMKDVDGETTFTTNVSQCDTITFIMTPSQFVQRHLLQLESWVTTRETSSYDRNLRIAEIKVTPLKDEYNVVDIVEHVWKNKGLTQYGVYNINGMKLIEPWKGLNIINGKKVFLRE